jgi:hypothetical protein
MNNKNLNRVLISVSILTLFTISFMLYETYKMTKITNGTAPCSYYNDKDQYAIPSRCVDEPLFKIIEIREEL